MKQVSQTLNGLPRGGRRTIYVEDSKCCTVALLLEGVEGGPPLPDDLRAEEGDSMMVVKYSYRGVDIMIVYGEGGQG